MRSHCQPEGDGRYRVPRDSNHAINTPITRTKRTATSRWIGRSPSILNGAIPFDWSGRNPTKLVTPTPDRYKTAESTAERNAQTDLCAERAQSQPPGRPRA